jgi:general bacterial porin, GBP family
MKKSLLALAALSAFATATQAQSNVTIYGAVGGSSTSVETNNIQAANAGQGASQDYLGTTNLGLKGTEDLGGGLKAFFALEGDLSMSGQLGSQKSDAANTNNIFNRQAHVGIESKDFGTVSIGRQNDSIKDLEGLGQVYNLSDNLHINTQVGDRYAQIIKYATPTFNGFKATYSYTNNAGNTGSSTDTTANSTADGAKTLNSFALSYTYKNYNFGIGQGTVSDVSVADDLETTFVGARATFGALTVGAHYAMNEQGANELNQTMVSVNYTMGKVDLKAHYVTNDASGSLIGTAGVATSDGKGYGLMAAYNLSKRTAAYVGYADFDHTNATTYDQKVTTIGLLHKF